MKPSTSTPLLLAALAVLSVLVPGLPGRLYQWSAASLQGGYDWVLAACGQDASLAFLHGTSVVGYVTYWVVGGLFTLADLIARQHPLRRYKTQPGTNQPVPLWPLLKCVAVVHVNQLVLGVPFVEATRRAMVLRGADFSPLLPSLLTVLMHLAVFTVIEEILFYYFHRLSHHRLLYKSVHKLHHEWQAPIAITSFYAHPVEHLFVIMLPVMAGPLLLGSHPITVWLWVFLATFNGLITHSGYHLPFLPSPQFHDFHHFKFTGCYGVLGVLDRLHGTDKQFRAALGHRNDRVFFSLEPPRPHIAQVWNDSSADEIRAKLSQSQRELSRGKCCQLVTSSLTP